MAENKLIIFHLADDFDLYHRAPMIKAFSKSAAGDFNILCVAPHVSIFSFIKGRRFDRDSLNRVKQLSDNLFVYTPMTPGGGIVRRVFGVGKGNYMLVAERIKHIQLVSKYSGRTLHWIFRPEQGEILKEFPNDPYVYECYDDYLRDLSTGRDLPGADRIEAEIIKHSKLTFVTSEQLFDKKKHLSKHVVLAPNGVDLELFTDSKSSNSVLFKNPVIGYVGNITDYMDHAMLERTVKMLPEFSFVFVGPLNSKKILGLKKFRNVHFVGPVERAKLPTCLSSFNIALIPFIRNEAMDAVNPLKLWEYFAAGRVVVSSPLKELKQYGDVLYFAKTGEELVSRIKEALAANNADRIKKSIELAKLHSWDKLTKKMAEKVLEALS